MFKNAQELDSNNQPLSIKLNHLGDIPNFSIRGPYFTGQIDHSNLRLT